MVHLLFLASNGAGRVSHWHQHFADSTMAYAVLDRLIHTAQIHTHIFDLK
ncbi:MAG: ATP-binding protein [Bacilli bacterium]